MQQGRILYSGIYSSIDKVIDLSMHLIGGKDFKLDFTEAKRKYYGSFNTIKTTVGRQVNEMMLFTSYKDLLLAYTSV